MSRVKKAIERERERGGQCHNPTIRCVPFRIGNVTSFPLLQNLHTRKKKKKQDINKISKFVIVDDKISRVEVCFSLLLNLVIKLINKIR